MDHLPSAQVILFCAAFFYMSQVSSPDNVQEIGLKSNPFVIIIVISSTLIVVVFHFISLSVSIFNSNTNTDFDGIFIQ